MSKSLAETLKTALSKKHAADHPDVKTDAAKTVKRTAPPAPAGKPMRRGSSRGG